jgi:type IV pilus assembly protein PilF
MNSMNNDKMKGVNNHIPPFIRTYFLVWASLFAIMACAATPWQKEQADSHINIGVAYLGTERTNDALREFLKAKEYTPREPRLHYYIGIAYHEKGMTDKAIASFNQALSLQKDYSDTHNFLGAIWLAAGQWDKAIDSFKKALSNIMYETPEKASSIWEEPIMAREITLRPANILPTQKM